VSGRVGVVLLIEGQEGVTWPEWVGLAEAAEATAIEGLFRSDHLTAVYRREAASLEAWTTLASLAPITRRLRLGTLVSPATFRHPSLLARMVATVDHVSGGRVELGIGAGWYEREHREAGIRLPPPRERFDLLAEQLEILVRTWTESNFDHTGPAYGLEGQTALPRPVQQPHPPVIVGGTARPRGAGLAARWAAEYNSLGAPVAELVDRRSRLDAACEAIGRDPASLRLSLMTTCVVGRDEDEVARRLEAAREIAGPDWADQVSNWLVGTPTQIASQARALGEARIERLFLKLLTHRDVDAVALIGDVAEKLDR
jgi:F420-dependent oxidoreductase-like protein